MPTYGKSTRNAWREARIDSYMQRSHRSLAGMLVDLEDSTGTEPQFTLDEFVRERRAARAKEAK